MEKSTCIEQIAEEIIECDVYDGDSVERFVDIHSRICNTPTWKFFNDSTIETLIRHNLVSIVEETEQHSFHSVTFCLTFTDEGEEMMDMLYTFFTL